MKRQAVLLLGMIFFVACHNRQESPAIRDVYGGLSPSRVVGIGKVTPMGGVIKLAAPASGIVQEIHAEKGNMIGKGDLLLTLAHDDEVLQVKEAGHRKRSQELTLESAEITLTQQKILYAEQQRLLKDAEELLLVGATTGENVKKLQSESGQANELLKEMENNVRLEQSRLNELKTQHASRVNDLERTKFRAPLEGVLLDLIPRVGEAVSLYQEYAYISPDTPRVVMVEIDELFADKLEVGQPCQVTLHGDSEVAATGVVTRISPDLKRKSLFSDSGTGLEDRRIREVEVSLNKVNKTLFIESKVECSIQIK